MISDLALVRNGNNTSTSCLIVTPNTSFDDTATFISNTLLFINSSAFIYLGCVNMNTGLQVIYDPDSTENYKDCYYDIVGKFYSRLKYMNQNKNKKLFASALESLSAQYPELSVQQLLEKLRIENSESLENSEN